MSIIDTRHSEIRPRMELQLNTNKDLNAYWYHLEVVCLNTRAGTISFSNRNYAENVILKKKVYGLEQKDGNIHSLKLMARRFNQLLFSFHR